jgi:vancomycin resistance protein YoaR
MIGQEAFPDLLATYSTKYAASNTDRTTNLKLAANKINGYVLLPGETFSYNTVVGERTIAAGYKEAAVYENGAVVQGLGGGICQISTTLFNAVLLSNLGIVELYNHQFVPSYATAGRDATVVYGVKDFKFQNTRNYAVKITCSVSGGVASFNIWGLKEDTEYDVSVNANVTSKTSSYIKSSTYRTLKLNGQVVKTEHIANFTYKVH